MFGLGPTLTAPYAADGRDRGRPDRAAVAVVLRPRLHRDRDRGRLRLGPAAADLVAGPRPRRADLRRRDGPPAADRLPRVRVHDPARHPAPARTRWASTGRSRGELRTIGTFFALAVFWDYMWFVFNPAYTVARFKRGNVWWFEVPWIWRFPLDYYTGIGLSIVLAGLAGVADGDSRAARPPSVDARRARVADRVAVIAAPLYRRWYRHMRREGATTAPTRAPTRRPSPTRSGPAACRTCRRSSVAMDERFKRSEFAIRLGSRRTTCSSRSTPGRSPTGPLNYDVADVAARRVGAARARRTRSG